MSSVVTATYVYCEDCRAPLGRYPVGGHAPDARHRHFTEGNGVVSELCLDCWARAYQNVERIRRARIRSNEEAARNRRLMEALS